MQYVGGGAGGGGGGAYYHFHKLPGGNLVHKHKAIKMILLDRRTTRYKLYLNQLNRIPKRVDKFYRVAQTTALQYFPGASNDCFL